MIAVQKQSTTKQVQFKPISAFVLPSILEHIYPQSHSGQFLSFTHRICYQAFGSAISVPLICL